MGLHSLASVSIASSLRDHAASLGEVLQLDADIGRWESAIAGMPSCVQLTDARKHLGLATYAATSGLYGQAFGGLRVFLELSFASVYFSINELHRRQWLSDRYDFSWSFALDTELGVLSADFVREFNADAVHDAQEFALRAKAVYKECSEFVHGKLSRSSRLPSTMTYSPDLLTDWISAALDASRSVLFLLFCRYADEILHGDRNDDLAETLEHSLVHLISVRRKLDLPVEGK